MKFQNSSGEKADYPGSEAVKITYSDISLTSVVAATEIIAGGKGIFKLSSYGALS
jgi:hypothetical protein